MSTLVAQVMKVKASLSRGEKRWKNAFEDTEKACREFKSGQKDLQQKKDDQVNIMKALRKRWRLHDRNLRSPFSRLLSPCIGSGVKLWSRREDFVPVFLLLLTSWILSERFLDRMSGEVRVHWIQKLAIEGLFALLFFVSVLFL